MWDRSRCKGSGQTRGGAVFQPRRIAPPLVVAISGFLSLCACRSGPAPEPPRPAIPVAVATAAQRTVPVELHVIGSVEAISTVSVKAQVGGELQKVFFQEGRTVRKGDNLFQIDPRPYELAVKQADAALARDLSLVKQYEANLARDIAQAKELETEAARSAKLLAEGIISREVDDKARTSADTLAQTVAADRAALESARTAVSADRVAIDKARLDLSYCLIRSPIDGRTGPVQGKEGNLIKANADTAMVVINQVRPIYVAFSIPESQLAAIRKHMAAGPLEVEATIPGAPVETTRGRLTFVDNTVDSTTGTIRLKATFQNPDARLWPGQFVDVALTLANERDVTVVPSEAVQNGPNGQFIYVVQAGQKVEMRPATVGRSIDQLVVIEKGIAPGEIVVTDGQLRLVPGATVQVVTSPEAKGPAPAGEGASQ